MTWPPRDRNGFIVTFVAVCCRRWDCLPGVRLGRCGYCGQVPVAI